MGARRQRPLAHRAVSGPDGWPLTSQPIRIESLAVNVAPKTLSDLGFPELLRSLSERCRTPMGRERALARPFLDTQEEVEDALSLVAEARALLQEQISLPFGGLEDVRDPVERSEKRALLEPRELLAISRVLFAFERARTLFEDRDETQPGLCVVARQLPQVETLARRIDRCFEPDGEISDRASPGLKEARDRARGLHRHIKGRLDTLLADVQFQANLRESYYSLRNGRYVVPVLTQHRSDVPGIVHNASQTGQTIFVEPEALIGAGNDLAIAQAAVLEEERRVLQELTDAVGRESPRILAGLDALARLDEAEASGVLAADLDATRPALTTDGTVELEALRHPRLVLKGDAVVANDVRLGGNSRALVISGPNAGGKTVTLSAVGLCALMLRAGLPIPAREGSRLPLFTSVHSSVGDAQDLEQGLSSFSAHVTQLREIARAAGAGSLALVDEIAADTDPREGAAIAIAVLEDLLDRGVTVLVTTHLEELKALAHMDPRFINARVGFDSRRMAPTFKLQLGASGSSSAIDVAARVGLSEPVIARARELAIGSGGPLSKALHATEEERRLLQEEREALARAAREAESRAAQLEREQEAFNRQRREQQLKFYEDVKAATEQTQAELKELLTALRKQKDEQLAVKARAELQARVEDVQHRAAALRAELSIGKLAQAPVMFEVGKWVHHKSLGRDVEILELGESDALVAAGIMKMRVPLTELGHATRARPSTPARFPSANKQAAALSRAEQAKPSEVRTVNLRADVRGMRAEEALRELEAVFDQGLRAGESHALVVHGHGTGALKQSVREFLSGSPYVRSYRPGEAHEGGDGVTLVTLRG